MAGGEFFFELGNGLDGLHDGVWVERHALDAFFDQEFGEVWEIGWALSTYADVFATGDTLANGLTD